MLEVIKFGVARLDDKVDEDAAPHVTEADLTHMLDEAWRKNERQPSPAGALLFTCLQAWRAWLFCCC